MTKETYDNIAEPFRKNRGLLVLLKVCNKLCTLVGFAAYPVLIALLYFTGGPAWIIYLVIPALCFVLLTVIRRKLDTKRPYELLDIEPLIAKEKKGNSFPSRHVFSMFLIAGCWCGVSVPIGMTAFLCGILLAVIRVIGGVHFPKDVAAGAVIGTLCGLITVLAGNI